MSDTHGLDTKGNCKPGALVIQPIWDRLDDAVIVTDCDLDPPGPTIRYVNRAFTKLTGYRPDEVIGRSPRLLQSRRTDRKVTATIKRDLRERDFARVTLVNRHKSGAEYLCTLVVTPLLGPGGRTEHFIGVACDLKSEAAAADLRHLSAELEQALTLVEDLEQRQAEAEALIDRQQREIALLATRHQAALSQVNEMMERLALRERALDRQSEELVRANAELSVSLEELRTTEEELRVSLDQIEQANVELERSNEELQRLQGADADKLRLLASASHDLRQPVMSMGLFLDVLRTRLGDAERPVMGGLMAAHLSIRTLLDGMLDSARLDAGVLDPLIEPVAMSSILEGIHGEFEPQAEMRGLRFRVVPCTAVVLSDAQLLERILRNLIANALKYTVSGGILLGCRACWDGLRVEVWDTGPGVPEAARRGIFEEFHQLDNPGRDQRRGVGLGLAIVARLARQLNHEIGLRSWVGRGSVFSVTVPLAPEQG
ncbi:HAMP domain-containing sensor histidine kinase [Azospirillum sp. TSO35-2]|uniref:PAS domain-containing sensor histidine kinase n=1 Tax=Azospirillum sp. TSO35-2 TaxID=716796 RepID=UPI000D64490B|nr:HAMP domain-containing sensor histidine kinase [Azospirillum sp. TSO35-2]